jgi:hypothetical protein
MRFGQVASEWAIAIQLVRKDYKRRAKNSILLITHQTQIDCDTHLPEVQKIVDSFEMLVT